jgi:ribonucleoside-triphosphate reductase (thioredoxin)
LCVYCSSLSIIGINIVYLTDEYINRYDDVSVPFGGNGLGHFVYLRTYSRWIPEKNRREEWKETCQRVVEYSMSLYQGPATQKELQQEAEYMFDQLYHLRVFPAGRTLWIGGSEAANKFGSANFNCAFVVMDKISAFTDLFHLLMVGAGVGFRILFDDVAKLPHFNSSIVVAHKPYNGKRKEERREDTVIFEESDNDKASVHIVVGDSKQGWVQALEFYLSAMLRTDVESIIFNYDSVRPAGEILKTFGGRASGHQALKRMFRNIHKIIKNAATGTLLPLHVLDIANHIGYNVVVGGVRRTSQIALFDRHDTDVLNAKVGLWEQGSANYGNDQRGMSNNSVFFTEKPTKETLLDIFQRIQNNGEPGFVNAQAASKRRPNFKGLNPCAEILLDDRGVCNLTEINLMAFVKDGEIDYTHLIEAVRLAVRVGLRQTNVTFDLPVWDDVQKRDRLTGVSLDGVMDFFDAVHLVTYEDRLAFLLTLQFEAQEEARAYAKHMRVPEPLLVTTIKPSGTISKLPGISSGIHRARAPYYIRRVRITSSDPLARVMLDAEYPIYPENNSNGPSVDEFTAMSAYEKWEVLQQSATWVIEFPQKSPTRIGIDDESALDQFQRYLLFQEGWTEHNTSITVNFAPEEIEPLVDMILDHWDSYVAISFLPKYISAYPLLPEEPITEDEYMKRAANVRSSEYITKLLREYEQSDASTELLDASCETGVCPVR